MGDLQSRQGARGFPILRFLAERTEQSSTLVAAETRMGMRTTVSISGWILLRLRCGASSHGYHCRDTARPAWRAASLMEPSPVGHPVFSMLRGGLPSSHCCLALATATTYPF